MKYLLPVLLAMASAAPVEAGIFSKFLRSRSRSVAAAKPQPAKVGVQGPVYRKRCDGTKCWMERVE